MSVHFRHSSNWCSVRYKELADKRIKYKVFREEIYFFSRGMLVRSCRVEWESGWHEDVMNVQ